MKKILLLLVAITISFVGAYGQERTVTGTVSDGGEPLPGVTVVVKGTSKGTITNLDGKFTLDVGNDDVLIFSFIGYSSQEIAVGTQSVIDVPLEVDAEELDEVVVTAMGQTQDKKSLGYAVQEVATEDLQRTGNPGLAGSMQGKISGVDIKPSSGMPGASTQINIRGARSFTGNNAPLYVIDGMPISSNPDFSTGSSVTGSDISNRAVDIDPNDIESINILKGQAAAALYGIRASNGVIIIKTKSGKGNKMGKPVVRINNFTSWETVSRKPEYQTAYSQGTGGNYVSNSSQAWGIPMSELPDDPNVGGNNQGQPGKYFVAQREAAGLDPWVEPNTYDNFGDYFRTGSTVNTSISVSQSTENANYSIGLGNTTQNGVAPSTGMNRWNAKGKFDATVNNYFSVGVSANYVNTDIDKLSAGNDAALAGVYAAPTSYDLKGIPFANPDNPYQQIYYRSQTFDNPYWAANNNVFNDRTDRFFGNAYVQYETDITEDLDIRVKYQLGVDTYTTHFQDIFEYGHRGAEGKITNRGVTNNILNSLTTVNLNWKINTDNNLTAIIGNEVNDTRKKTYTQDGQQFNFGGWRHIENTKVITAQEEQRRTRTVGFFASVSYSYKSLLYLTATGRTDYVSTMPRNNRNFFYPSISGSLVLSEMDFMDSADKVSLLKLRASWAQVGQAGEYFENFYALPTYGGGWFGSGPFPISYPLAINGANVNSYTQNAKLFDPNLKPQNTASYELGADLGFFNDRITLSYTYSRQNVTDQIFAVPLTASTGFEELETNGGKITTNAHEVTLNVIPVQTQDWTWSVNVNYSRIISKVDELADGVESIFLGGFTTPQVRAAAGYAFPVIYGSSFQRGPNGGILVNEDPNSADYGLPMAGPAKIIGDVTPDFILGFGTNLNYKTWSLGATFEWKQGGQMYSGSNGLINLYGVSEVTADRTNPFVYPGEKADGSPNDIQRGGESDTGAYQRRWDNVEGNIDEAYIYDNSFVKLRELSLGYKFPNKIIKGTTSIGLSVFARNILLWTELPNFDPESSQGNNNMGGSFERFSMPNTNSFGFGVDITF
ncbi:SusC/RagA family TonB-linked outer membrane protein [Flammeovirga sp. EKP202]|uniref:SusC/RagA family TonB-linked outer membrane protein n=1 Tax=Flammeovirga sp. EKP202 TaxID=2770592 RepID=UPI00165F7F2C|nr:SusC/RagA family TonB-linked outer membrane protein [Flammeovirga sp. EKP202]MBD0404169.1 SusC/RagA family TonB-linked outer membrane protein [Flammeovirga sp. EKP202]